MSSWITPLRGLAFNFLATDKLNIQSYSPVLICGPAPLDDR